MLSLVCSLSLVTVVRDPLQIRVPLNVIGKPEGRPFLVTAGWHSVPLLVFSLHCLWVSELNGDI